MAVADGLRSRARARPKTVTAVLSLLGYVLVLGTFGGFLPIYPELSDATVNLFGHLIAVINTVALGSLLLGVWFIRNGDVRKHRAAMLTAFTLILLFLVVYLWKIGGGFEKAILATGLARIAYLLMLIVHIGLSVVAVPVVIHAVVLGLTHTPAELRNTAHARVGRIAVAAWSVSLFLGVVTYILLAHVYGWEPRHAGALLLCAVPWRPGRGN
jgi:putative membrane protein